MTTPHPSRSMNPSDHRQPVLVVDLDGTLLRGDLLWESLIAFVMREPWKIFAVAGWWAKGGRPGLKANLAERVAIDGTLLVWNEGVVEFCRARHAGGQSVVIATASNETAAKAVTAHFPFLTRVIGSDRSTNLKSQQKAGRLVDEFGAGGFDYVGDCGSDLPVWRAAREAWVVAPEKKADTLERALGRPLQRVAGTRPSSFAALVSALRPHQWLKNLLVFFPVLTAHRWADVSCWRQLVPVFLALCCMASASYLLNDLSDLEADRRHARKKNRAFASGDLSVPVGVVAIFVLLLVGVGLAATAGGAALAATVGYFVLSAVYSLGVKTVPVLDTLFLSGLYTYRMVIGGISASVMISAWLLAFSTTFFLGLAFLKRYVELEAWPAESPARLHRRGYERGDLAFVHVTGIASSFLSVVVLALYLESSASSALYRTPEWLWAIALILLLWMMRVWFLAGRKKIHDDPVWFAARDPATLVLCALCVAVVFAAGPLP